MCPGASIKIVTIHRQEHTHFPNLLTLPLLSTLPILPTLTIELTRHQLTWLRRPREYSLAKIIQLLIDGNVG